MRIISGIYRSRVLKSPGTNAVRPTSDRAKETLFNMLSNRIDFEGLICMDIFCGAGSLGLESISRGASMCWFVDKDTELVKKNVDMLKANEFSKIIRSDALTFLENANENPDLVFCDPPYDYKNYDVLIEKISKLKPMLVLEHSSDFVLNPVFKENVTAVRKIGAVNFTIFDFN